VASPGLHRRLFTVYRDVPDMSMDQVLYYIVDDNDVRYHERFDR
jgi:hypothetical protein